MRCLIACLGLLAVPVPSGAQTLTPVDVELVLAVDISYSVDLDEARRQREGYVAALAHPDVISAIQAGPLGRIAVTYVEWADAGFQRPAAPWTVIASEADAMAFAAVVAAAPLERGHYTAIGSAIADAVERIETNAYDGHRRLIDLSGDGPQNHGMDLMQAREMARAAGITVNGLPILTERPGHWTRPVELNLDEYFDRNVAIGPGAFVLAVREPEDIQMAILRKMTLEIAGAAPARSELTGLAP
ncbi:MAG: hypothetical protein CMF74_05565 [Maricaulis sp.]|jgi:hypothetical protein|nr:hypothetical protein [Maricaulis sp.]HAQ36303.1 hypothetical protein [Alphaproteobacteria bacterium]